MSPAVPGQCWFLFPGSRSCLLGVDRCHRQWLAGAGFCFPGPGVVSCVLTDVTGGRWPVLVSVSRVPELCVVERTEAGLKLGAALSLAQMLQKLTDIIPRLSSESSARTKHHPHHFTELINHDNQQNIFSLARRAAAAAAQCRTHQ